MVGLVQNRRLNEVNEVHGRPFSRAAVEATFDTIDCTRKSWFVCAALTTENMLALRESFQRGFNDGSIDSLDAIVPPNDPIRARRPPVLPFTLNAAATPRATPSPARAPVILPVAAQPTRADEPSGRGGGGGGRSKLQNRLDGHKTNQLATALFTFHNKPSTVGFTGHHVHAGRERDGQRHLGGKRPQPPPRGLCAGRVVDWKELDVPYDLYGGL